MTVQRPIRPPTDRQADVARLLAYGASYKRIGFVLGISPRVVKRLTDELAGLIPVGEEGEHPEYFEPRERVIVWAYWEYRIKPTLRAAA